MKRAFLALSFILAMVACGQPDTPGAPDNPDPGPSPSETSDFSFDLIPSPLAALDGGWKPGGQILLIVSGESSAYVLPSSTTSSLALVKGKAPSSASLFVASPYGQGVQFLGSAIGATIPDHQSGKDAAGISFSAAKLTGSRVQMKDLSARLTFSLKENTFSSLKVSSLSDAKLAGRSRISFPSGTDGSLKAEGSSATVTFSPGQGDLFPAGDYTLVCLGLPEHTALKFEAADKAGHSFEAVIEECGVDWGCMKALGNLQFEDVTPDVVSDGIPDFSRVGYHYGDKPIPDVEVRITLEAPADKSDATALIQDAITKVQTPGCILLKAGTYYVGGEIKIEKDGVVLRGEGAGTVIYSTATTQQTALITIGKSSSRSLGDYSDITDPYTPCSSMSVRVADPGKFSKGDVVFIYRPATQQWISDLHMDELPERSDGGSVSQWTPSGFKLYWERRVTEVRDGCVFLDNPVVMGFGGNRYGTGRLYHGSFARIRECGIEHLTMDSRYDDTIKKGTDFTDEDHCWHAVRVLAAEHSWIRDVQTRHFGNSGVLLDTGAKLVTVEDCHVYEPVSVVTGGRRYAFNLNDPQQCLVKDCSCDNDRHQFVLGSRVSGPNVFLRCTGTNSRAEAGPHHRWSTGTLFDNVSVSTDLNLHDRSNAGSGHGWACANTVLYNCTAKTIVCQSPWVSAQNWAIGCIGQKKPAAMTYADQLGTRPDGVWISPGVRMAPESLYESQLEERHAKGIWLNDL